MLLFAALAVPMAAVGQQQQGSWSVDVVTGLQNYDAASGMNGGAFLGAAAMYSITDRIAVGPSLQYTRHTSDESFFTGVLDFGADSARVYQVGQTLNTLNYTLDGRFDFLPANDFNPYVMAGIGGYTTYLETQPNDGFGRLTDLMFQFGGGIRWSVSPGAGVAIDLRDVVYNNWDREQLNPIRPEHRNCSVPGDPSSQCRFPLAEAETPSAKSTIHNLRFAIGLTFIPGAS
jgi:opacity protein-like surface antigen